MEKKPGQLVPKKKGQIVLREEQLASRENEIAIRERQVALREGQVAFRESQTATGASPTTDIFIDQRKRQIGWSPGSKVYFYIKHNSLDYEIDDGYIVQTRLENADQYAYWEEEHFETPLKYRYNVISKRKSTVYEEVLKLTNLFLTYEDCKEAVVKVQKDDIEQLVYNIQDLQGPANNTNDELKIKISDSPDIKISDNPDINFDANLKIGN